MQGWFGFWVRALQECYKGLVTGSLKGLCRGLGSLYRSALWRLKGFQNGTQSSDRRE